MKNFKSVEEATIELAPLTVLVGPNSAGKSSLLQSILLFAQNARRGVRDIDSQARGQLVLNGDLVGLGTLPETLCDFPSSDMRKLTFGATFNFGSSFRPMLQRFGTDNRMTMSRSDADSMKWTITLAPDSEYENSGIAITDRATIHMLDSETVVERAEVSLTNGSHINGFRQAKNVRFSNLHTAHVEAVADDSKGAGLLSKDYAGRPLKKLTAA